MTAATWPQIAAAATSLRTVGGAYEYVADALEHDHQVLREESTMTEARDKALRERKAKRNPNRCNPDTEFTLGFDAGAAAAPMFYDDHEVCDTQLSEAIAERDAALAVIERVLNLTCGPGPEARRILTQTRTDALAEHDRRVKAEALEEARDKMMPPLNWNLDPTTGNERPGTSTVDQVYGDVHRELTNLAAEIRAAR